MENDLQLKTPCGSSPLCNYKPGPRSKKERQKDNKTKDKKTKRRKDTKLMVVTNILISTENWESKSFYGDVTMKLFE